MSEVSEAAGRIARFLDDEVVQQALAAMQKSAYQAFLMAEDDDGRREAHAKAKVLDTFEAALRAVVDEGERERLEQERRDRAPATRTD